MDRHPPLPGAGVAAAGRRGCASFLGWPRPRLRLGVVAHLLVQRVAIDAEAGGGFYLHVVTLLQDLLDQFAFDAADELVVELAFVGRDGLDAGADQLLDERGRVAAALPSGTPTA